MREPPCQKFPGPSAQKIAGAVCDIAQKHGSQYDKPINNPFIEAVQDKGIADIGDVFPEQRSCGGIGTEKIETAVNHGWVGIMPFEKFAPPHLTEPVV